MRILEHVLATGETRTKARVTIRMPFWQLSRQDLH